MNHEKEARRLNIYVGRPSGVEDISASDRKPSFELQVQQVKKFERTSYYLNCILEDGSSVSHPISTKVAILLIGYGLNHSI